MYVRMVHMYHAHILAYVYGILSSKLMKMISSPSIHGTEWRHRRCLPQLILLCVCIHFYRDVLHNEPSLFLCLYTWNFKRFVWYFNICTKYFTMYLVRNDLINECNQIKSINNQLTAGAGATRLTHKGHCWNPTWLYITTIKVIQGIGGKFQRGSCITSLKPGRFYSFFN